jgi:Uma2 family endonuclease
MITTPLLIPNSTLLQNIRWETYQSLLLDLAEAPSQRLSYDRGTLEIMNPLPEHETHKRLLGRLVETTTEALGIEIYSLGSTTWSRQDLQKGIEPDEAYYISHEATMRGKQQIDLTRDPAPDLAIEIDTTSSYLDRLSIYAALGISEIWRFDGENLTIYILQNGTYHSQEQSHQLPLLTRTDLLYFLSKQGQLGENALIREFRQWLTKLEQPEN